MANDMFIILELFVVLFLHVSEDVAASVCYYNIEYYGYSNSKYCTYGCCNYNTYNPCCYSTATDNYYYNSYNDYWSTNYVLSAGAIAGIIIGCIVGLSVFITIIICVCNASRRQNGALPGRVIAQQGVPFVIPGPHASAPPHPYPYGGNINGGFLMGPIYPEYSKDDNLAPPPYHTIFQGENTDQQLSTTVENQSTGHNYFSQQTDTALHNNTCLTPQTGSNMCFSSAPSMDSNYYSTISDSSNPTATATMSTDCV